MRRRDQRSGTLPTIRDVLSRVHFRVTLFAVAMAGVTVFVAGMLTMRAYAYHNLVLIAQSASYTVEAALVFDDRTAAAEGLNALTSTQGSAEITVKAIDGRTMAHWRRTGDGLRFRVEQAVGRVAFAAPVDVPIRHEGRTIGTVIVRGDAGGLGRFLAVSVLALFACLAITAVAAILLARRLQETIAAPLQAIATVAHAVRCDRALDRRAPPSPIAEIDALAQDFNALLAELEGWHGSLQTENAALAHRANHDVLTGLGNRAAFDLALERTLADARASGATVALLYLDSDRFKETNDLHGHDAGDAVLIELARRIDSLRRPGDIAARLGGDEFAVLLRPPATRESADRLAARLCEAMADPILLPGGGTLFSSLSIGIALFPQDAEDAQSLVRAADIAMYADKSVRRRI